MTPAPIVFLVDVDETLLHTDRFDRDLADELERRFGAPCRERYCAIESALFASLGYRDYLGALQQYRVEHPFQHDLMAMSSYVLDYPLASRLYPGALDVLARLRQWGQVVILTDGDAVLQPRKVERTGIYDVVDGHVLIYIHKERALADIQQRYPAQHYVLVDDKLRILTAFKQAWGERVTTVMPRQGHFANDPAVLALFPPADLTVNRIGQLLSVDFPAMFAAANALRDLTTIHQPTKVTA